MSSKLNRKHWLAKDLLHWWATPDSPGVWRDHATDEIRPLVLESGSSPLVPTEHGNNAIDFSTGASEFTDDNGSPRLGINPTFTVGFWAKYGAVANNPTLLSFIEISVTLLDFSITPNDDETSNGNFAVGWNGGLVAADPGPRFNEWHHYVFVTQDNGDFHEIFMDGRFLASASLGTNARIAGGPSAINIGHKEGGNNYNGECKDITVHGYAMSNQEVWRWYQPQDRWGLYAPQRIHVPLIPDDDIVVPDAPVAPTPYLPRPRHIGFIYG